MLLTFLVPGAPLDSVSHWFTPSSPDTGFPPARCIKVGIQSVTCMRSSIWPVLFNRGLVTKVTLLIPVQRDTKRYNMVNKEFPIKIWRDNPVIKCFFFIIGW